MKKSTKYAIIAGISFIFALIGLVPIFDYDNVWLGCVIICIGIIGFIVFIVLSGKEYYGKQESADREEQQLKEENQKTIKTVKILGTRAGLETRVLGTYNFTIYSMLIVYKNGEREVVECESKSERFKELIKYIEVGTTSKQSDPLSIDEMIDMDEMND